LLLKITKKKEVFNYCEPYIIAELGSNHNGDMKLAKELILKAKEAGADCVKFQSWSKDTIFAREKYEENYFLADDYRNREDYTLEKIVEEYSISEEELLEMKRFADEVGIDCTSTPFSKREVDFLVDELESSFIKVASMDLNNYPFLEYIAKKNRPIILSTGLSELYEIDRAIRVIEDSGNSQIVILHCISKYPPKDEEVNLNNIKTLQTIYEYPVGFSDHTLGYEIPLASVAFGACMIEKHFTLDKNMEGWDHRVSATPDEMKIIVEGSKRVQKALGSYRITAIEDIERRVEFRRSIVVTRDIKKGEILKESDIDFKRPARGLAPEMAKFIVGRRVNRDLKYDSILKLEDIE
jgi:N-acetylneuraminate synthase